MASLNNIRSLIGGMKAGKKPLQGKGITDSVPGSPLKSPESKTKKILGGIWNKFKKNDEKVLEMKQA